MLGTRKEDLDNLKNRTIHQSKNDNFVILNWIQKSIKKRQFCHSELDSEINQKTIIMRTLDNNQLSGRVAKTLAFVWNAKRRYRS